MKDSGGDIAAILSALGIAVLIGLFIYCTVQSLRQAARRSRDKAERAAARRKRNG